MGVEYNNSETRFAAFKATEKRRRLMKKEWEAKIGELSRTIIEKLASLSKKPVPTKDSEDMKVYNTLKDTFNAFDNDGSAELGYPEYVEAWKFLGRGKDEKEIKQTFDSVDVDKSGIVDWSEFAFSLMGEKALRKLYLYIILEALRLSKFFLSKLMGVSKNCSFKKTFS